MRGGPFGDGDESKLLRRSWTVPLGTLGDALLGLWKGLFFTDPTGMCVRSHCFFCLASCGESIPVISLYLYRSQRSRASRARRSWWDGRRKVARAREVRSPKNFGRVVSLRHQSDTICVQNGANAGRAPLRPQNQTPNESNTRLSLDTTHFATLAHSQLYTHNDIPVSTALIVHIYILTSSQQRLQEPLEKNR